MRARSWVGLVVATVAASSPARAEDVGGAREHFAEGVKRFQNGDFEGARESFRLADSEHHAPAIVYNIARAEERLGQPQAAVESYEAYLVESGDQGEFGPAAALGIAQIKTRSPRVRVVTDPSGARIFVDGRPFLEPSPSTFLVSAGRHHSAVEGDGWRREAEIDAIDPARVAAVTLARPSLPGATPPNTEKKPNDPSALAPQRRLSPDDFIYGAAFALVPYAFMGKRGNAATTQGLAAGGTIDLGYALTDRAEIFGHIVGAIGSEGSPFTSLYAVGAAFSIRALPSLWVGAGFLGGRADSSENGRTFTYGTDYVFSPMGEISVALLTRWYGQWLLSAQPAYLVAAPGDNSALYVPISFGLRSF